MYKTLQNQCFGRFSPQQGGPWSSLLRKLLQEPLERQGLCLLYWGLGRGENVSGSHGPGQEVPRASCVPSSPSFYSSELNSLARHSLRASLLLQSTPPPCSSRTAPVSPTSAKNLRNPGDLFSQAPSSSASLGPLRTSGTSGHGHRKPSPGKGPFSLYMVGTREAGLTSEAIPLLCLASNSVVPPGSSSEYKSCASLPCSDSQFVLLDTEVSPFIQLLLYERGFSLGCYSVFSQWYQDSILKNGTSSPPALTAQEAGFPFTLPHFTRREKVGRSPGSSLSIQRRFALLVCRQLLPPEKCDFVLFLHDAHTGVAH